MRLRLTLMILFAVTVSGKIFPQGFTAGIHSGLNFSDIHSGNTSGKWKFKPGPYQGAFLKWNINRIVGVKAGVDYSTLYYEHVYSNPFYPPVFYSSSSTHYPSDLWFPYPETFDYNILSFPLQLQLTVPSRPDLHLSAGVFYSFVSQKKNYGKSSETDFGYIFSSGWSLPLSESFSGMLNVSYVTGKREISDYGLFRHGSFNFSAGFGYNFGKRKYYNSADSSAAGLKIVYLAGVNTSWNGSHNLENSYYEAYGPFAGFRLEMPVEDHVYFVTGMAFERAGYSVKDSSDVTYAARTINYASEYIITRTGIDYITIPAMFMISPGRNERFYVATGPYVSVKLNARTTGRSFSQQNTGTMYQYIRNTVYNDVERMFKGNDAGWAFGAGVNFPLLGYTGELGLLYKRGFRDVFDATSLPAHERSSYGLPVHNRIVTVHFGIKIPAKRRAG